MRIRAVATAVVLLATPLSGITGARAAGGVVTTLRPDVAAFWDDRAPRSTVQGATPCTDCATFAIDVRAGGKRIKVAADGAASAVVRLLGASGNSLVGASGPMSAEVLLAPVPAGRYYVQVEKLKRFRVRALLESAIPNPPKDSVPLLPDLRLTPPYEFTYTAGCNTYEVVEYNAKKCLRFSLGPENIGPGPFLLRVPMADGLVTPGPVYQRIQHRDGTISERQAGTGLFHKTHRHYHHNGFGSLEIFKVTDPKQGTTTLAGTGPKQGFCMLDFRLPDWRSFRNAPMYSLRQDCEGVPLGKTDVQMGLSSGWGDIYVWNLDGNYVEMGTNGDGYYLLRSKADADNVVLETNETNNTGYAYIRISGTTVTLLERGYGTGPWDRNKRRADDLLPWYATPAAS